MLCKATFSQDNHVCRTDAMRSAVRTTIEIIRKVLNVKKKNSFVIIIAIALILPVAIVSMAMSQVKKNVVSSRPEGPCDIYASAGCPCVAAHSTTRALYVSYNGPLYQVMRQSD